ncbi:poly(A) RNA polymerase, mitochondrial-like [Physella acuta]|uniref:poly(A) RNA polymerase, mitochondrial-like n=1 Tax=Physella acuta TaxID=109671 RepID=UPI0027DAC097|nr:poly(A) RNA polymerase, mitochondrial-like [Physella acuta]
MAAPLTKTLCVFCRYRSRTNHSLVTSKTANIFESKFVSILHGKKYSIKPSTKVYTVSKSKKVKESNRTDVSDEKQAKATKTKAGAIPLFNQILEQKYSEARRSILVRTYNVENTLDLLSTYGRVSHAQLIMPEKSFLLVEFSNEINAVKVQNSSQLFNEANQFPMRTRILCDTKSHLPLKKRRQVPEVLDGSYDNKISEVYPHLPTVDKEIEMLCERRLLDDQDLRLRFFACLVIEDMLQSVLPESRVIPYGSCMNGFGWWNSDLDMMICLDNELKTSHYKGSTGNQQALKFLTEIFNTERQLAQRTLSFVAALLELSPRVNSMLKILGARVPIIRFKHNALSLPCDVSLHAVDSIKMTELLYLMSVCDSRVKPLLCAIKQWAIAHNLTSSGEQQKPTTIGFIMMLIFFLQTRTPAVLPTFRQLQTLAKHPSDKFFIDDVEYGLPKNPSLMPISENKESLENLLLGFFEYYSQFDFDKKAISITEGATFEKQADSRPIYIENPLSVSLNICQNVGSSQLSELTAAMKEAALKLKSAHNEPNRSALSILFETNEPHPVVEAADLFREITPDQATDNQSGSVVNSEVVH